MYFTCLIELAFIIAAFSGGVSGVAPTAQEKQTAASQPTATKEATEATPTPLDPTVDKILSRLEARRITDLRCAVTWKLRYLVDTEDEAITKKGTLWYQEQKPCAKFLIHFEKKISGGRLHKLDERHMFDGRWYIELDSETRSFSKREIRREGEEGNPYKLGEGPFPVPFGQKKADILREFEAALVPAKDGDPDETDHLKLTPRKGSGTARSYQQVDVWIAREGRHNGLPIKVEAAKTSGTGQVNSILTISFDEVQLDTGFSSGVFQIECPAGFSEQVETLDSPEPAKGEQSGAGRP